MPRLLLDGFLVALLALIPSALSGQVLAGSAWFGIGTPPGIGDPHAPTVDVASARAVPVRIPFGEERDAELKGERLFDYLEEIVGLIDKYDGIGFTRRRARELVEQAKGHLAFFPESSVRTAMFNLADYVVSRSK